MKLITEYPEKLVVNRKKIEGAFVFSLWKSPELYGEYELNSNAELLTPEARFYYSLGKQMYESNYQSFDDVTILTYISKFEEIEKEFNKKGGCQTVNDMKAVVAHENVESYYDEILKNNAVLQLFENGYFFKDEDEINKVQMMNYAQLEDYLEYKINNIFLKSTSSGLSIGNLTSGYEKWIKKWDEGHGVGLPVGYKMMNYNLAGIHTSNLILHLGGIGQGKSSSALLMYVLPILEAGEQVLIVANEQNEEQFAQMLLGTILFNRIQNRKGSMNRQKLLFGKFTDDEKDDLKRASEYLKQFDGKLHYVHLTDYGTTNIKRVIKKYSKLGVRTVIVDTLKPTDESSDKAWAEFSETAKMLFTIAQKEDIAIIATAQLSSESAKRKYLDLSCIGKSRAIAETASTVLMFRPIRDSEKDKLFVYNYIKGTRSKQEIKLDKEKDYVVYFIAKNRYGGADIQIVYERNMSFNTMKEVGYCHIEYDGFSKA